MRRISLLLLALPSISCVVADDARPRVVYGLEAASESNHRGMVQNEKGVLHPSLTVALPAKQDGTLIVRGDGTIDLSNDTGDAWLPDGHGGRFSQLDWVLLYQQALEDYLLVFGVVNYNLPNGTEFPFGERGATTELMFELTTSLLGTSPGFRLNYDIDEVEGAYLQAFVGKSFELAEDWSVNADLSLGWMDEEQAWWNYAQAPRKSGLADVRLAGEFVYRIDDHTSSKIILAYSDIVESEYRDWLDTIGIDSQHTWIGIGIEWSY